MTFAFRHSNIIIYLLTNCSDALRRDPACSDGRETIKAAAVSRQGVQFRQSY